MKFQLIQVYDQWIKHWNFAHKSLIRKNKSLLGWAMAVRGIEKSRRRDQVTILSDLLLILQEPTRLTHVLYRSGMSYTQLVKYLKYLQELGMIDVREKPFRAFLITEKGKVFMNLIKRKDELGYDSLVKYVPE